ncbi:MAG TPA: hypothetical protein VFX98_02030 [Longimicrobiaceae bacterium]|nr:hypothetical protein [Longimicrobiaceae bacterium]
MSGTGGMGDPGAGTAEVHSDLHAGGSREEYSGLAFADEHAPEGVRERTVNRVKEAGETLREGAGSLGTKAKDVARTAADRAGSVASQARDRMSSVVHRAEDTLERQGVLEGVRRNALPALGIAFGIGLLLAGRDNKVIKPGTKLGRTRNQVRDAVLGGLTAAIATEARSLVGGTGQSGFLRSLMDTLENKLTGPGGGTGSRGGSSGMSSGMPSSGMSGTSGTTTTHRPPSHQETF